MRESNHKSAKRRPAHTGDAGRVPIQLRHQQIMQAFRSNGFISVTDMAGKIGVSTMTIRRDLMQLESEGKIARTHGGAVAAREPERVGSEEEESIFDRRLAKNARGKSAIARAAAALIEPAQSVGLDAGTTILTASHRLAGRSDLRFFTTNLRAALALSETKCPVYVAGGEVRFPEGSVVGSAAIKTIRNHFLDVVLLGVSALDENGIYDFSPEDTEVKRAFIDSASRIIVLCDASKFGRRALARVEELSVIDVLVTDQAPQGALAAALREANVQVVIAPDPDLGAP